MKYLLLIPLLLIVSCTQKENKNNATISACQKLKPLTKTKHPIRPGEWRESYTELHEPLQAYVSRNPTSATAKRNKLYVLQIGAFDKKGIEILEDTKAYLKAFFQIEVDELPLIDLSSVNSKYTRQNDYGLQLQTGIILDSLLPALLPENAFALIAFTTKDLYPNDDWNFVFGQASLKNRVGVWSLVRFGDYNESETNFTLCLNRTLQVASHETGHIFGIKHCVVNECCMNGSNSLPESDEQPSWLCWECLAKICWNRKIMPQKHLQSLLNFHRNITHDISAKHYYEKALKLLEIQKHGSS